MIRQRDFMYCCMRGTRPGHHFHHDLVRRDSFLLGRFTKSKQISATFPPFFYTYIKSLVSFDANTEFVYNTVGNIRIAMTGSLFLFSIGACHSICATVTSNMHCGDLLQRSILR